MCRYTMIDKYYSFCIWILISLQCRDGVEWFFVSLHKKNIPVLIISGGLGGI